MSTFERLCLYEEKKVIAMELSAYYSKMTLLLQREASLLKAIKFSQVQISNFTWMVIFYW